MSAADLLMKSYFSAWVKETPRTPGYVAGNVNTMHLAQLYDDFRAAEAHVRELEAALREIRETLACTNLAPRDYDANHHCSVCGGSSAFAKDLIDTALASQSDRGSEHG